MKQRWLLVLLAVCLLPRAAPAQTTQTTQGLTGGSDFNLYLENDGTAGKEPVVEHPSKIRPLKGHAVVAVPTPGTPVPVIAATSTVPAPTPSPTAPNDRWCYCQAASANTDYVYIKDSSGVIIVELLPPTVAKLKSFTGDCGGEYRWDAVVAGEGGRCTTE